MGTSLSTLRPEPRSGVLPLLVAVGAALYLYGRSVSRQLNETSAEVKLMRAEMQRNERASQLREQEIRMLQHKSETAAALREHELQMALQLQELRTEVSNQLRSSLAEREVRGSLAGSRTAAAAVQHAEHSAREVQKTMQAQMQTIQEQMRRMHDQLQRQLPLQQLPRRASPGSPELPDSNLVIATEPIQPLGFYPKAASTPRSARLSSAAIPFHFFIWFVCNCCCIFSQKLTIVACYCAVAVALAATAR